MAGSRHIYSPVPSLSQVPNVATLAQGGTGADNATDAVINLGGLSVSQLNQENGVAKADENGILPIGLFPGVLNRETTLIGSPSLLVEQTATYVISNHDSFKIYEVEATSGSVSILGDTITYTAPSTAGIAGFTVNGEQVAIVIVTPSVSKPSITSPVNNSVNLTSAYTLTANAFSVIGGTDTHEASDWQLSTTINFSAIVQQTATDAVNKTSWPVSGLLANTIYYARVRYKGVTYGYGEWSTPVKFTTRLAFIPETEEAILVASDKAADDALGFSVRATADGVRVIVGARAADPTALADAGAAYIYSKEGGSWVQEAKLLASDKAAGDLFGHAVDISADGTRAVVTAIYHASGGLTKSGSAYVYSRAGTTWTQEAILTASDKAANDEFGRGVAIDSTGTRIAIGAPEKDPAGLTGAGAVYVYSRSGTSWTQEAVLTASDKAAGHYFGSTVGISAAGDRVVTGAQSHTSNTGAAYVFSRSVTTWAQEAKLIASNGLAGDYFGFCVDIDDLGSTVVIGAPLTSFGGLTNIGTAYVFSRTDAIWSQESVLQASDKSVSDFFCTSVSISGNGTKIIIGSDQNDPSGLANAGAVYVFAKNAGVYAEEVKLTASNMSAGDQFGWSISISGDGAKAFIGSKFYDAGGIDAAGGAYVFI